MEGVRGLRLPRMEKTFLKGPAVVDVLKTDLLSLVDKDSSCFRSHGKASGGLLGGLLTPLAAESLKMAGWLDARGGVELMIDALYLNVVMSKSSPHHASKVHASTSSSLPPR